METCSCVCCSSPSPLSLSLPPLSPPLPNPLPKPCFRQPNIDKEEGENKIERVFIDFCDWESCYRIHYHIVLTGENAWSKDTKSIEPTATLFYRANNSNVWGRTADINRFYFQFCVNNVTKKMELVGVGFGRGAFSGDQSFFDTDGGLLSIPLLFSSVLLSNDHPPIPPHDLPHTLSRSQNPPPLFSIQMAETIPCQSTQRPIIYMNTCNHLMHLRNTNSSPPSSSPSPSSPSPSSPSSPSPSSPSSPSPSSSSSSPSSPSRFPLSFHTYTDNEIEFVIGNGEDAQKYGREQVQNRAKSWACWLMWALRIRF